MTCRSWKSIPACHSNQKISMSVHPKFRYSSRDSMSSPRHGNFHRPIRTAASGCCMTIDVLISRISWFSCFQHDSYRLTKIAVSIPLINITQQVRQTEIGLIPARSTWNFSLLRLFDFFGHLYQQNPTAFALGAAIIGSHYVAPTWRRIGPWPLLGSVHTCCSHSAKRPLWLRIFYQY